MSISTSSSASLPSAPEVDATPFGRSKEDVDFWLGCVGAPVVLVEKSSLRIRRGNANAAVFFGLGLEPFSDLSMEELVGRDATLMLSQIWSVAPFGKPGEPFLVRALVNNQERLLMVQVTKLAVEGEPLRLFTFVDAPPEGSVALAGWQENVVSLLNWLPFGFEIASTDDQIQFANSTFQDLFGYTQDQVESIEDWWRVAYPDPQYREFAKSQWYTSIAAARSENREMTPFDLNVMSANGVERMIQFRHRTIGNFNVNLYIDVTKERAYAEQLRLLANTDALTGVVNRRRFFEQAEEVFARSAKALHPVSVVMLDIDHFKSINDRFGHRVGDLVLTEFTRRCQSALRPTDWFARLGGEEFAVLLEDTDLATATAVSERIRATINSSPLEIEGTSIDLSVSIGVTTATPSIETFDTALSRADKALYDAKDLGRDRVVASAQ